MPKPREPTVNIDLDASRWETVVDFGEALMAALGSPEGHGLSVDAFIDSMIWGGMNKVDPPYNIRIINVERLPDGVLDEIKLLKFHLAKAREEFRNQEGHDVEVDMEILGERGDMTGFDPLGVKHERPPPNPGPSLQYVILMQRSS